MTRNARGRAPQNTGGNREVEPTVGKRITPSKSTGKQRSATRTRAVQIGAICFVLLLLAATLVGCAKYNGDQAAFCAGLKQAPSFASLSTKVNDGTDAQAAEQLRAAAVTFRGLEKAAPRSIRVKVSTLGDSAERIAKGIESGNHMQVPMVSVVQADGSVSAFPVAGFASQQRMGVFYDEFVRHPGTVRAMYSLAHYATNTCGLNDGDVNLGVMGYGPTGEVDSGTFGVPTESMPVEPTPNTVKPGG